MPSTSLLFAAAQRLTTRLRQHSAVVHQQQLGVSVDTAAAAGQSHLVEPNAAYERPPGPASQAGLTSCKVGSPSVPFSFTTSHVIVYPAGQWLPADERLFGPAAQPQARTAEEPAGPGAQRGHCYNCQPALDDRDSSQSAAARSIPGQQRGPTGHTAAAVVSVVFFFCWFMQQQLVVPR